MLDIVLYISRDLGSPSAAERLALQLVEAAEGVAEFPYAMPSYVPIRPLEREYRKLVVQNHIMFYWVDEGNRTITVARVIYAGRDHEKLL